MFVLLSLCVLLLLLLVRRKQKGDGVHFATFASPAAEEGLGLRSVGSHTIALAPAVVSVAPIVATIM